MTFAKISQVAHYSPSQVISNQDLSERMDTSDEWIASRTGIRKRHISKSESTSDLATEVARRLLKKEWFTCGSDRFYHCCNDFSGFYDAIYSCSCSS